MADRTLANYTEPAAANAPVEFTLNIERAASGEPTLVITLIKAYPSGRSNESTIIVQNADKVLEPVMEWLWARREVHQDGGAK